jgi:hypothetical protein
MSRFTKTAVCGVAIALINVSVASAGRKADFKAGPTSEVVKLSLKNGLEFTGNRIDLDSITVNSLFGHTTIPIDVIAGIRFAQGDQERTTIVLHNGDTLTGEIDPTSFSFVSNWGESTIDMHQVVWVVFRPGLSWSTISTPAGTRWTLIRRGNRAPYASTTSGRRVYARP